MNFKKTQYVRAEKLIRESDIFDGDEGGGYFKRKAYPFILQDGNKNLFAQTRNKVNDYFRNNEIAWWNGKLTNHPLSSQVACLNHLFPIRENKQDVLSLIQKICPDIADVLPITTDAYKPAYVQFESVSDFDHLHELNSTRGSNCTSIDALFYGIHNDGQKNYSQ